MHAIERRFSRLAASLYSGELLTVYDGTTSFVGRVSLLLRDRVTFERFGHAKRWHTIPLARVSFAPLTVIEGRA